MTTFHDLHASLEAAYQRTTNALNELAASLEALPGSSAAAKPAKPAKPKPKPRKPAEVHRNGRPCEALDVNSGGF